MFTNTLSVLAAALSDRNIKPIVRLRILLSEKLILQGIKRGEYYRINSIPTHMTKNEKLQLFRLASTKKGFFIEIGSYLGSSSCFIAHAINERESLLYCIDTWQNDAMSEGNKDTFEEFEKNTRNLRNVIRVVKKFSTEAVEDVAHLKGKISFLFVDGDHSYGSVKKDWEIFSPFLLDDAIVVFHDSGWAEGVQRVIREYVLPRMKRHGSLPNLWWGWYSEFK